MGDGRSEKREMEDWWEDRSLPQKIAAGIALGILGIAFLALCGWMLMSLWNWLMPDIFGLKTIDYWQAWGLFILSMIFFHGGSSSGSNGRRSERKRKRHLRQAMQDPESMPINLQEPLAQAQSEPKPE